MSTSILVGSYWKRRYSDLGISLNCVHCIVLLCVAESRSNWYGY